MDASLKTYIKRLGIEQRTKMAHRSSSETLDQSATCSHQHHEGFTNSSTKIPPGSPSDDAILRGEVPGH